MGKHRHIIQVSDSSKTDITGLNEEVFRNKENHNSFKVKIQKVMRMQVYNSKMVKERFNFHYEHIDKH